MQQHHFFAPTRIILGAGSIAEIGMEAKRLRVARPLIVTDAAFTSLGYVGTLCAAIRGEGMAPIVLACVSHEPTAALVDEMAAAARAERCDAVIGLGGGAEARRLGCLRESDSRPARLRQPEGD